MHMLESLLFEHTWLSRHTNMFNPDFTVNCLISRNSLPSVSSGETRRKTISFPVFLSLLKGNIYFLFHVHMHTITLLAIHYILKRELKLSYPLRLTKCKINSRLNEVHKAMENYLSVVPSEMCISDLISVVFLEEIKILMSYPCCTFSLKLKNCRAPTVSH